MSVLDPKVFAQAVLAPVVPHVRRAIQDSAELKERLEQFQEDVERTIDGLKRELDPNRAANLRLDLELFLPARKAAILAAAEAHLAGDIQAALEGALEVAVRVAITVAKAFVVGGVVA